MSGPAEGIALNAANMHPVVMIVLTGNLLPLWWGGRWYVIKSMGENVKKIRYRFIPKYNKS